MMMHLLRNNMSNWDPFTKMVFLEDLLEHMHDHDFRPSLPSVEDFDSFVQDCFSDFRLCAFSHCTTKIMC